MKLPKIIGFTGKAGSGKSYAAYLLKRHFPDYGEFSFACSIKRAATFYMNWNGIKDKRGRALLQDIGMAGRRYNPDCWVRLMPTDIELFIDDVRFENEAQAIRDQGGIVIRIVRDGLSLINHVSEKQRLKVDFSVVNNGTETFKNNLLYELNLRYGDV